AHRKWRDLEEQLAARQGGNAARDAQLELLRFQVTELEAHAPTEDEPAQLQTERGRLANIDKLASGLDAALYALSEAETGAAHSLVARAQPELSRPVEHDDSLAEQLKSLATA